MKITTKEAKSILTRSSGYLTTVSSHSLQPYRGCSFGRALCGVGCYVQHNWYVTRGEPWGSFLEVKTNAADLYRKQYKTESAWARRSGQGFVIFMSSSTDPLLPQEDRFGVTRRVLEMMTEYPPDGLILQTHSDRVANYIELLSSVDRLCDLRVQLSIESDRDRLPGLPPPASSVEKRFEAASALHEAGLRVVITVSPLFPIEDPRKFFRRISEVADAVVIDHFIHGDGSSNGSRTLRTELPAAMERIDPESTGLAYRDRIIATAREIMPGRVGVSIDGFAGRFE